jgi:hypothetical protein
LKNHAVRSLIVAVATAKDMVTDMDTDMDTDMVTDMDTTKKAAAANHQNKML